MILPKGSVEFTYGGGEDSIRKIFTKIGDQRLTGYISVKGNFVGNILFMNGNPKLAEMTIDDHSLKSNEAAKRIMQMMSNGNSRIEWHSNIDPGPPMAFFKDCLIDGGKIDINDFLQKFHSGNIEIDIKPKLASQPPMDKSEKRGLGGFIKKLFGK